MSVSPLSYSNLVLDTSVILKWFRQSEKLASQALKLREMYLAGQVVISAPTLLAYELANALRYKSELTTEQAQQAVQSLFDMELAWLSPAGPLLQQTVEIARTYDITVYDAAFVALAKALAAEFITADERLAQRLQAISFVHFLGNLGEGGP